MNLLLNALKGQVNTLNLILLLCILAYLFNKLNKRRTAIAISLAALFFFILTSTAYLPSYLIHRLEDRYPYFNLTSYPHTKDTVFIHSLGGGYTLDEAIGPAAQLSLYSLGRLSEAIRIARSLPNSILVVSGNISSGDESLASVSKKTAFALGIDSVRVVMLETPATTQEEALAFVERFGIHQQVIVVTDAVHMPRAITFFKQAGIQPYPAPTNYFIKKDENPFALRWVPSVENMLLMDRIFRELFGSIKGALFN